MNPAHKPRILVTRSPHQASDLADHLRALGAEPILIPTIEIVAPTSFAVLESVIDHLDNFDWLVFTSGNAVVAFYRWLRAYKGWNSTENDPQPTMSAEQRREHLGENAPRVAAIGKATAEALTAIGLPPDLIPPQAVAESLADALLPHTLQPDGSPSFFLLIRAEDARDHIPRTLRAAGAQVVVAPVYRTVTPTGSIDALRDLFSHRENYPDAITFTSSSTARNLFALLEAAGITLPSSPTEVVRSSKDVIPPEKYVILSAAKDLLLEGAPSPPPPANTHPKSVILSEVEERSDATQPKDLPPSPHQQEPQDISTTESTRSLVIASIGPITSATLRDLGHPPDVEATEATVAHLAENLVKYLHLKK